MKIFSSKKRVAAIGAVTALTLVGGGAAFAYWTTSGSGTGSAATTVGSVNKLSFVQSPVNAMYPGDSEQTFSVTVRNTDAAEKAYVTSLGAYITTDAPVATPCDGTNFLINGVSTGTALSPTALNWTATELDAASSEAVISAANKIQFNNKVTPQDSCKNVNVTVHYVAN
jgi:hypothetical protein